MRHPRPDLVRSGSVWKVWSGSIGIRGSGLCSHRLDVRTIVPVASDPDVRDPTRPARVGWSPGEG